MIIISGAELLQYTQENRFLGDAIRFAINKNLNIRGLIYKPSSLSGVSGVLQEVKDINAFDDWEDIIINGENFGRGKINRITYPEGDWVRILRPTISITIYESGDPVVISGHKDFSGIYNLFHTSGYLINSLDENISISDGEDGTQSLDHTVTMKLNDYSGLSNYNPCFYAENLSDYLFNNNSQFNNTFLSGYVNSGIKTTTRKRSYDLLNDNFQFNKRYDLKSNIISGTTFSYNLSLNIDEKGLGTVIEAGQVKGVVQDYYNNADIRYMIEALSNSFGRCSGMYGHYYTTSSGSLKPKRLSLRSVHNKRAGIIDYTVEYTDNPRLYDQFLWDYQISFNENQVTNVTTFSEQGTFRGNSDNPESRYDQALSGYIATGDKTDAFNRVFDVYTGNFNSLFIIDHPLTLLNSTRSLKKAGGEVDYNYELTNDITRANLTGVIRRIVRKDTIKASEDLIGIFKVNAGDGYELEQFGPNYIPGEYQQDIEVELHRLTIPEALDASGFFADLWALVTITGTYSQTSFEFSYPNLTARLSATFKKFDGLLEP